jgi:hypothetical protein
MVTSVHAHRTLSAAELGPASPAARGAIFSKLRDPALLPNQDSAESDMPMIWSDYYTDGKSQPLTPIQYETIRQWSAGDFVNDATTLPQAAAGITPAGLDRAALEACVGAAMYPGIEAGWMLRDLYAFEEPFRLDHATLVAGDVTKQMAVPWQADFYDCTQEAELAWWPAQRPDEVFPERGGAQVAWIRKHVKSATDMVRHWHRLGFIVKKGSRYVETERHR